MTHAVSAISEAAVVAVPDEALGVKHTALRLYMIPDVFSWHEALPRTSTDKTDYQRLKELA